MLLSKNLTYLGKFSCYWVYFHCCVTKYWTNDVVISSHCACQIWKWLSQIFVDGDIQIADIFIRSDWKKTFNESLQIGVKFLFVQNWTLIWIMSYKEMCKICMIGRSSWEVERSEVRVPSKCVMLNWNSYIGKCVSLTSSKRI